MPVWAWVAVSVVGFFFLALVSFLFLFRIRYRLALEGWKLSAVLEYGFPGFMRTWDFSTQAKALSETVTSGGADTVRTVPGVNKSQTRWKERGRCALFLFLTDLIAWRSLLSFGMLWIRLTFRLLRPELDGAVGHPDPAFLGRLAGYWYAATPWLGKKRVHMDFRFQDRERTLRLSIQGGVTAARVLGYGAVLALSFPWLILLRRAWHGWCHTDLTGWRLMVYRRLRKTL